ncbi:MAG: hypothetical protein A2077_02625 [Nitrospirae bacterium GWC2_46_6]|nr:MAG: hypothetical protein A2077_02625 [Nitrospirae bacterium GWC2_46_6]OGW20472.1 MAG: hypothetical protein A2Z82_05305 [Nitrospirae bacterium GWA2_46_11]OGW24479.1 MAG: hypothetical protein A2X55_08505 [Nitrospirae bacterium GWB2_47_37]HCL80994.1 hypothetical protein [Nitrospiraceae bacterium]
MRLKIFSMVVVMIFAVGLLGCVPAGRWRQEPMISYQIDYKDAFREAINSCRDLNLVVHETNKDAGEIRCLEMGTFLGYVGALYKYVIFMEIDKNSKLKNIKITVFPTDALLSSGTPTEKLDQYYNTLKKRLDIK